MANQQFKSIDTYYNGYKFRSRLEARWAVFFDELGIAYDHEPEGFDLNGVWYLPDLHLHNNLVLYKIALTQPDQLWVEIKPTPELKEKDRQKIDAFAKQTDHHILLISGQPDINVALKFIDHHPKAGWVRTDVHWLELPDGKIGIVPHKYLDDEGILEQTRTPRLQMALNKARQARFEHGQTPRKCQSCAKPFTPNRSYHRYCEDCYMRPPHKLCQSCGKQFSPRRAYHVHCHACYKKQMQDKEPTVVSATEAQPEAVRGSNPSASKGEGMTFLGIGTKYVLQIEGSRPAQFVIVGDGSTTNWQKASKMGKRAALSFVASSDGKVFKRRLPIIKDAIFEF